MNQLALFKNDNAGRAPGEVGKAKQRSQHSKAPASTGQCAQVLNLIRQHQPLLSLVLTADYAIPEAAGWNVRTEIRPVVLFRGVERRNVAAYSLGVPEWPAPGYFGEVAK